MAQKIAEATQPDDTGDPGIVTARAGALRLTLLVKTDGMQVVGLHDEIAGLELAAPDQPPLFRITLKRVSDGKTAELRATDGWHRVRCSVGSGASSRTASLRLEWAEPEGPDLKGFAVRAIAHPDAAAGGCRWTLRVENASKDWGIQHVAFPQVTINRLGDDAMAFYPTGPGIVQSAAGDAPAERSARYPGHKCTMQFMAAYSHSRRSGLYVGLHDPLACTKELAMRLNENGSVETSFSVPAPDMGKPGVGYVLPGEGVWRLLRGDWYDAARIYREWVRKHAHWFPKLRAGKRTDTPRWMQDLSVWGMAWGAPSECADSIRSMRKALDVPIGFHWYGWHEIPFDNDYPHYFPTKPGLREAVAELQSEGIHVMPYINGRLWDTRDRGLEDWQFTARALPSAAKNEAGDLFIENYGIKEADGSPVRFAVMCPTTRLWQETMGAIVARLFDEIGVRAVYIDQIAAEPPVLCMDPGHGHTLGGGSWWTAGGYWPMLRCMRTAMPADRAITTECAAEPYTAFVDGFLSWEWQYQGMVPALQAVYAGSVQYFGRNYAAGASTRDLALCMKMGQQLVFGEQIGWLDPAISKEPVAGAFLRLVVRTRQRFVRNFSSGDMARPPQVFGDIPSVRGDWAWAGRETWITLPAILTGAWMLPRERRLLMLYVNVSDVPVRFEQSLDLTGYGVPARRARVTVLRDPDGEPQAVQLGPDGKRSVELPGRSLEVVEVTW